MQMPLLGLTLALGLIVSTYLVTDTLHDIRLSHQIIKVRGYAEQTVESDRALWTLSLRIQSDTIKNAYPLLTAQTRQIKVFLNEQGIDDPAIHEFPISIHEQYKLNEQGISTNEIDHYALEQGLRIDSSDVRKIAEVSTQITRLIEQGIAVQSHSPQFYFSGVNELKSQLLTRATQDARVRAQTLAEGSGAKLGFLKAARQGSFGILAAHTSNVAYEEGYDDTSSIMKKVTAVVTVDYSME